MLHKIDREFGVQCSVSQLLFLNNNLCIPGITAIALYAYEAEQVEEISLIKDDIIIRIERVNQGWWRGIAPSGKRGLFPSNYVELQGDLKV